MQINEITINKSLQTFESLLDNIAINIGDEYQEFKIISSNFNIYARDIYTQEEITDLVNEYTISLKRIADSKLTADSQTYNIAFAILDYFKQ